LEVEGVWQKRRGMNKLLAWTILLLPVLTLATWADESRPLEFPTGGWEAEGVEGPARK